jgi:hypothetical protein
VADFISKAATNAGQDTAGILILIGIGNKLIMIAGRACIIAELMALPYQVTGGD